CIIDANPDQPAHGIQIVELGSSSNAQSGKVEDACSPGVIAISASIFLRAEAGTRPAIGAVGCH
ncbi:MAG TPA: hypothetical protein VFF38_08715, partial [Microvirga sp.]|nr:hypothetical protein [Microvirga sp.]